MPPDPRFELRVDWIRCDGFGLCGDLAPELIELDEWRYPMIRGAAVDPASLHEAQRAVDCCPMKALRLELRGAERNRPRAVAGRGAAVIGPGHRLDRA